MRLPFTFGNQILDGPKLYRALQGNFDRLAQVIGDLPATVSAVAADLAAHLADASDAHDASAVSISDAGGYFTGTDVEAALQEVGSDLGSLALVDSYTFACELNSPADGSNHYFGHPLNQIASVTTTGARLGYIGRAGRIKSISATMSSSGGSNENISLYVRVNGAETLVATVGSTSTARDFRNSALSIAVSAGDTVEFHAEYPTWTTNPTNVYWTAMMHVHVS